MRFILQIGTYEKIKGEADEIRIINPKLKNIKLYLRNRIDLNVYFAKAIRFFDSECRNIFCKRFLDVRTFGNTNVMCNFLFFESRESLLRLTFVKNGDIENQ